MLSAAFRNCHHRRTYPLVIHSKMTSMIFACLNVLLCIKSGKTLQPGNRIQVKTGDLKDGREPDVVTCQVTNSGAALLTVERMLNLFFFSFWALTGN